MSELATWLLQQIPAIIIMGIVMYFMYKYIKAKDKLVAKKDEIIMSFADKAISAIEASNLKSDVNSGEHKKILDEINDLYKLAMSCKTIKNDI